MEGGDVVTAIVLHVLVITCNPLTYLREFLNTYVHLF